MSISVEKQNYFDKITSIIIVKQILNFGVVRSGILLVAICVFDDSSYANIQHPKFSRFHFIKSIHLNK